MESVANRQLFAAAEGHRGLYVFGQCDYYSGALIDVLCLYAVHCAVLIILIDCFYSCWKGDRVLAVDEVALWKCAAIDLMSEEEDGTRLEGGAGWIVRPLSFHSREHTELCATLQSRLEAIPNYRAAPHRRLQKQTLCGAVGFWAPCELPICCMVRLCFVHAVCLC